MRLTKNALIQKLPSGYNMSALIPIILEFIKQYKIKNIKDHEYHFSGGGCTHYFILLQNNRIVHFSNVNDFVEISYNAWNSIELYYEIESDEIGFGREMNQPDENKRVISEEDIQNKIISKTMYQYIHQYANEHIDENEHNEDTLEIFEIKTRFGLIAIRYGEITTAPGYDPQYMIEVIFNKTILGHFLIVGDPNNKKVKYKINYLGLTQIKLY